MSKTIRRLTLVCVIAVTAFGVTTGVASADKPARGCPTAYGSPVAATAAELAAGVDKNNDGMVCRKDVGGSGPNAGPNSVDNTSNQGS